MVTAKITCTGKNPHSTTPGADVTLHFAPDYADGRNKEWAAATPALNLVMSVKASVAEMFEVGDRFTLQFAKED